MIAAIFLILSPFALYFGLKLFHRIQMKILSEYFQNNTMLGYFIILGVMILLIYILNSINKSIP